MKFGLLMFFVEAVLICGVAHGRKLTLSAGRGGSFSWPFTFCLMGLTITLLVTSPGGVLALLAFVWAGLSVRFTDIEIEDDERSRLCWVAFPVVSVLIGWLSVSWRFGIAAGLMMFIASLAVARGTRTNRPLYQIIQERRTKAYAAASLILGYLAVELNYDLSSQGLRSGLLLGARVMAVFINVTVVSHWAALIASPKLVRSPS